MSPFHVWLAVAVARRGTVADDVAPAAATKATAQHPTQDPPTRHARRPRSSSESRPPLNHSSGDPSSSKSNIVIKLTSNKHKEKREFRFLYYDKKKSVNTSSKTFLPFDPNKIKLLEKNELIAAMGPPNFKRLEGDVITWQYSNEICVLDVFFEKNSEVLIFLDTRSQVYGKMLNEDKCYKVFGQKVLSVD